jgi:hypothetical protein
MSISPIWTPNLQQVGPPNNCDVDICGAAIAGKYNLGYQPTYKLKPIDVGRLPQSILTEYNRTTGIGIIPLLNFYSTNTSTPIKWYCVDNSYAIVIKSLDQNYYVSAQGSTDVYNTRPYNHVAIINGAYNGNGVFLKNGQNITVKVRIDQSGGVVGDTTYTDKSIQFPFTIIKIATSITLKSKETILSNLSILGSRWAGFPIIQYEYYELMADLSFSQFATTDRILLSNGNTDYNNIKYYITRLVNPSSGNETLVVKNDYISISNNNISLLNATYSYNVTAVDNLLAPQYFTIPIAFYQDEDAVYKQSSFIGDSQYSLLSQRTTIQLKIVRSVPKFTGQTPSENTGNPNTIYLLPNLSKMTNTPPFEIVPPITSNTDSSTNFVITSNMNHILQVIYDNNSKKFMAYIYDSGIAMITVYQKPTRNFNSKTANFFVFVNLITPSVINCNNNIVYTNPYQSQFWTRYKPPCPNYNLTYTLPGSSGPKTLTPDQVDDVYSMRRKAEILKYNSNVGGLTKSQKYAKAVRGELMRQIGNENKYLQYSDNSYSLTCKVPTSRVLCGLTSACGVPGKERVLCYDPSINVYNLTRTYEYRAGLQTTSNIPTLALTQPRNLVGTLVSGSVNKINLTWDSPVSNGGLPITGYIIAYSENNKTWIPYKSIFPNGIINPSTGEKNANYEVFESITGTVTIKYNQTYYISVFSANERGLSSVPSTITIKTGSVPSIITNLSLYNTDRKNTYTEISWTDPINSSGSSGVGYNGPPITGYIIAYKITSDTTWNTRDVSANDVIKYSTLNRRYTLNGLTNSETYAIKISPVNDVGFGPESRILFARTLMPPGTPTDIKLTPIYGFVSGYQTKKNYIHVVWTKPDNGGQDIKNFNITITDSITGSTTVNQTYTVENTVDDISFDIIDITKIENEENAEIVSKIYYVKMSSYNNYARSIESIPLSVTVLPYNIKPTIIEPIITYYNINNTLEKIKVTIFVGIFNTIDNPITQIRIEGLDGGAPHIIEPPINVDGYKIYGSGLHSFYVPAIYGVKTLLSDQSTYNIKINLNFGVNGYNPNTVSNPVAFSTKLETQNIYYNALS